VTAPLPVGEGLSAPEPQAIGLARREGRREASKGEGRLSPSAGPLYHPKRRLTPTSPPDPHPTGLRPATFSQWEKGYV